MRFQLFIIPILLLSSLCGATAQHRDDSVQIHFRQSKTYLDTAYMSNKEAFRHIQRTVDAYNRADSDMVLLKVKVSGGASPEGSTRFNNWLSKERAARIYDYINRRIALPDSIMKETFVGRDWHGLRSMVISDSKVPNRDDVVALLDIIIEKIDKGEEDSNNNVLLLKKLHNGIPYAYLYRNIFPRLREASVVLTFGQPVNLSGEPFLNIPAYDYVTVTDFSYNDLIVAQQKADSPFYMALKTNMLADILALPEIGAEFYLGKNISIVGNWMYGWWDRDRTHRYWRAYGGDIALRWWFGKAAHKKPLTGHHVGVYGGVVTYDFEFGGKGHMGGRPGHNLWDRCMHYCGVEYGYSLPIARRLNIDFTIGLGYMGGKYVEYVPKGRCYKWIATKQKHWVGPTKLEVSLVWLIGHGNYNTKKGVQK